jgi:hypothetical protein
MLEGELGTPNYLEATLSSQRAHLSLISLTDVDDVFSDGTIQQLAKTAKFPVDADLARFGQGIKSSIRRYLEVKPHLSLPELRKKIERLG